MDFEEVTKMRNSSESSITAILIFSVVSGCATSPFRRCGSAVGREELNGGSVRRTIVVLEHPHGSNWNDSDRIL